ncbi:hypothetical protein [Micromonospora chersina]|uniref:hypothetical protein n=1 Tax=Micromonospora chersina TaxID=47854 RepID=UPI00370FB5C1
MPFRGGDATAPPCSSAPGGTGRVVRRGYAEWCVVFDIAVGVTTLLGVVSG